MTADNDDLSHLRFGTKSPYTAPSPAEPLRTRSPFRSNARSRLIHVSIIARHGTRNPTKNCVDRMLNLQAYLRAALPNSPTWLDRWTAVLNHYSLNPGDLTVEGEQEMWSMGHRFARHYAPSLDAAGGALRVRSSYKSRAVASARSFLEGYLHTCADDDLPLPIAVDETGPGSDSEDSDPDSRTHDSSSITSADDDPLVEVLPIGRDTSLRYFEQHTEYVSFATKHKALMRREFSRGPLSKFSADLAKRLTTALNASIPMDINYVRTFGEACLFDYAHGRASASVFCKLLTPKDTALLEIIERRHRPFFKAHERFRTVAAPLVADIVASLTACVGGSASGVSYAADLRFAHAETLVPLLLLLGIRSNGLALENPDYRPGLSAMSPFGANLAIELYEDVGPSGVSYFVRFRLHERYVERIPALGDRGRTGTVRLEHLLEFFEEVLEEGMNDYA